MRAAPHIHQLWFVFWCRFRCAAQADSRASSCTHLCRKLLLLFQQTTCIFSEITSPRLLYRRRLPQDDLQDICKDRRDFLLQEEAFSRQERLEGQTCTLAQRLAGWSRQKLRLQPLKLKTRCTNFCSKTGKTVENGETQRLTTVVSRSPTCSSLHQ